MTDLPETTEPNIVVVPVERTRTEYVTRTVNVHEHRAPTDESVRLLREMQEKAEAEVVKSVSVSNTLFECVLHQHIDNLSDRMFWRAIFKLNGKQMTATNESDPRRRNYGPDARDNFAELRDEMAKVVATEILNDAFVAAMRARFK